MIQPFLISALVLLICILLAALRVILGPTVPDRVVGLDTINTLVIVSMILFGSAYRESIYIDTAIVYALLSFVTTIIIAKYLEGGKI
ncbi:MAG: cation:proton antiporter [Thermoplasmata archaeon]|nr:MAG: cation:proton antiporter [Thermoplasmata archaeon]HDO69109.1 cation:proton antiporter [Thermoplasmatales archaeon]HEX17024.1 cation:proton antiporter [Thermoplasmatales archaeon]